MSSRKILCEKCGLETRESFPTNQPYPMEHVIMFKGKSLGEFVCDYCNRDIGVNDIAVAMTIWAEYGGYPYSAWEHTFLTSTDDNFGDLEELKPKRP